MDEAILGLDAEDAREAGARWSWQVQNGRLFTLGFDLGPLWQAQWFGVVYLCRGMVRAKAGSVALFLFYTIWIQFWII